MYNNLINVKLNFKNVKKMMTPVKKLNQLLNSAFKLPLNVKLLKLNIEHSRITTLTNSLTWCVLDHAKTQPTQTGTKFTKTGTFVSKKIKIKRPKEWVTPMLNLTPVLPIIFCNVLLGTLTVSTMLIFLTS